MLTNAKYPTVEHERASEAIVDFFSKCSHVEAIILKGSCARGKATNDSCLDIAVLMRPEVFSTKKADLEGKWIKFYETTKVFKLLQGVGKYSHVDLDFIDGDFEPQPRSWTSGPDEFELEIGNSLVYTVSSGNMVTIWNFFKQNGCHIMMKRFADKGLASYVATAKTISTIFLST